MTIYCESILKMTVGVFSSNYGNNARHPSKKRHTTAAGGSLIRKVGGSTTPIDCARAREPDHPNSQDRVHSSALLVGGEVGYPSSPLPNNADAPPPPRANSQHGSTFQENPTLFENDIPVQANSSLH